MNIIGKATSINVRKVLWTCAELALPYTREDWNETHAALNPNGMVPVLVDGGFVLWESNTICRYLCARHGSALLDFTLADVVLGLSVNRWMMTPMAKPAYRRVTAYYDRLNERSGFREFGRNGVA